jgi:F-type H+-transporting ATPase subunit delta
MPRYSSPRRYAQAVLQIALERDELDIWREDLAVLAAALDNREISELLDAPQVPSARKLDVIRQTLDGTVGLLAINLVSLLALKGLAHLVPVILDEYARYVDAQHGIERAEVIAAVPLGAGQQARVGELLTTLVGSDVRVTVVVDPQILGGLIARVSDRVIDGSVRTRLNELRRGIVERVS